jgi:hypothetical protein
MTNETRKWHGHHYGWTAAVPPGSDGALALACTCGHRVVVDDAVPEGEARMVDGITRVQLTTSEDLDRLTKPFRNTDLFPACPIHIARLREAAGNLAEDLKTR